MSCAPAGGQKYMQVTNKTLKKVVFCAGAGKLQLCGGAGQKIELCPGWHRR
jgi:hypothetical protein